MSTAGHHQTGSHPWLTIGSARLAQNCFGAHTQVISATAAWHIAAAAMGCDQRPLWPTTCHWPSFADVGLPLVVPGAALLWKAFNADKATRETLLPVSSCQSRGNAPLLISIGCCTWSMRSAWPPWAKLRALRRSLSISVACRSGPCVGQRWAIAQTEQATKKAKHR